MNSRIQNFFRIGTLLWMSYPAADPMEAMKKIICDPYFEALELPPLPNQEERRQAAGLFSASLVTAGCGYHPVMLEKGLNPNALCEEERIRCQKWMLETLDQAYEMGCTGVAYLAGKYDSSQLPQHLDQLDKTTSTLCAYAQKKNMTVELEIFDYDFDKSVLVGPCEMAADFAKNIRKRFDNFGLLADLSHFPLTRETSEKVFAVCAPYLTHFHIGNAVVEPDCEGYGDTHPRFGLPHSANHLDTLVDFLKLLKRYTEEQKLSRPILSFEIKPRPYEDPDAVLAGSKRILDLAWSMV